MREIDDFLASVPPKLRENADFRLDRGLTEEELRVEFARLAHRCSGELHFLGAGFYDNTVPSIIEPLAARDGSESLRTLFEFQTIISRLTGMEVTQAVDDGARALLEAVLMAGRLTGTEGRRVLMASSVSPELCKTVRSLLCGRSTEIEGIPWRVDGTVDLSALGALCAADTPSAVVVGMPNSFGVVEPLEAIKAALPAETILVAYHTDPSALSIFEPAGADIAAGDARSFGMPPRFGGPSAGYLSTRRSFLDEMPGVIAVETRDSDGRLSYTASNAEGEVITGAGATPAVTKATLYLGALGTEGFVRLGETLFSLFEYLRRELERVGIPLAFSGQHYREGVFEVPNLAKRYRNAIDSGLVPGILLAQRNPARPDLSNSLLVSVSPKHRKADLDRLVEVLSHG